MPRRTPPTATPALPAAMFRPTPAPPGSGSGGRAGAVLDELESLFASIFQVLLALEGVS
jgi:hypothetical protein